MKKFTKEIAKKVSPVPSSEVINKNTFNCSVMVAIEAIKYEKEKRLEEIQEFISKKGNSGFRIKKSFEVKHSDNELYRFLERSDKNEDLSFYGIQKLKNLKSILEKDEVLRRPIYIAKEIAFCYHNSVSDSGENRGNISQKSSEMYSDKYKEKPEFFKENDLSAFTYSELIEIKSCPYKPRVFYHSKLKEPNADSYKHCHEIVIAKQISGQTGHEVFVTGDCGSDDPELIAWIGDASLHDYHSNIKGQQNVDFYRKKKVIDGYVVVRGDLKQKSLSKVLSNDQLGKSEHPYDSYFSIGTISKDDHDDLVLRLADNALADKEMKFSKALFDAKITPQQLEKMRKELDKLHEYKAKKTQESLADVENVYKVIPSTKGIKIIVPAEDSADVSSSLSD